MEDQFHFLFFDTFLHLSNSTVTISDDLGLLPGPLDMQTRLHTCRCWNKWKATILCLSLPNAINPSLCSCSQPWHWSEPCSPACSGLWGPSLTKRWSSCTVRTAAASASPRTCSTWRGTPPWSAWACGRGFPTAARWRGWSRSWSWCRGRTRPSTRCCCCCKCASASRRPWAPYMVRPNVLLSEFNIGF